jgi:hypothetical protein
VAPEATRYATAGFVSGDLAGARASLISTSVIVIAPAIAMGIAVVE